MRNAFAAVLLEPVLRLSHSPLFFFGFGFVVRGRICECAGYRIEHNFKETANGCDLARCEPVDEFVNLLLFVSGVRWHGGIGPRFILSL
jgi:hypothetical protein